LRNISYECEYYFVSILIIGINGSPRKNGMTAKLVRKILRSCEKNGTKTIYIDLIDKKISQCLGCYSYNKKTVSKGNMQEIS
jgi:multimeric flavodoxin WrbA